MSVNKTKHIFLRHGRLKAPYDNYENMSGSELRDLANEVFKPDVDPLYVEERFEKIQKHLLLDAPVYLHVSSSSRAQQTAGFLQEMIRSHADVNVETVPTLREVEFDLDQIYPEGESVNLSLLNNIILEGMAVGHEAIESYDSIKERVEAIMKLVKDADSGTHIYITHDFLMRAIDKSFRLGTVPEGISASELQSMPRNGYLEGFELNEQEQMIGRVEK
jgi:hypothetical protein